MLCKRVLLLMIIVSNPNNDTDTSNFWKIITWNSCYDTGMIRAWLRYDMGTTPLMKCLCFLEQMLACYFLLHMLKLWIKLANASMFFITCHEKILWIGFIFRRQYAKNHKLSVWQIKYFHKTSTDYICNCKIIISGHFMFAGSHGMA